MLSRTILLAFAKLLCKLTPPRTWYRCALWFSRSLAAAQRLIGQGDVRSQRYQTAILLNRTLAFLSRSGQAFPVPWQIDPPSLANLAAATTCTGGKGTVLCSAHLPLVKVAIRAMIESGFPPAVAIAAEPGRGNSIPIWGLPDLLPTLKVQPDVLVRTRTVLKAGGAVVLLVDTRKGEYSPNIFKLAAAAKANVLFFTSELDSAGSTRVRIFPPPHPGGANPSDITGNLLALDQAVKAISNSPSSDQFDTVGLVRLT